MSAAELLIPPGASKDQPRVEADVGPTRFTFESGAWSEATSTEDVEVGEPYRIVVEISPEQMKVIRAIGVGVAILALLSIVWIAAVLLWVTFA